ALDMFRRDWEQNYAKHQAEIDRQLADMEARTRTDLAGVNRRIGSAAGRPFDIAAPRQPGSWSSHGAGVAGTQAGGMGGPAAAAGVMGGLPGTPTSAPPSPPPARSPV